MKAFRGFFTGCLLPRARGTSAQSVHSHHWFPSEALLNFSNPPNSPEGTVAVVTGVLPGLGGDLLGSSSSSADWLAVQRGRGEVSVAVEEERNERMDGLQRDKERGSNI